MVHRFIGVGLAVAGMSVSAVAQQTMTTLPFGQAQPSQGIYTTHDQPPAAPAAQPLPWQQNGAAPVQPASPPPAAYVPFQKATPYGSQAIPAPLPMNRSVPVENIDGVEVSEPAAPASVEVGANPAEEDPAAPTELTAPLFAADADSKTPREIVLRVLNKVTAQAEELKARPGSVLEFGKLQIQAVQCYQSSPASQSDSVALLSIREQLPDRREPKLLFHGWMYASSPSLTALEHPIYDVTMVDCHMLTAKPAEAVDAKKTKSDTKKP